LVTRLVHARSQIAWRAGPAARSPTKGWEDVL